jgi:alkaline phosphatase D
MKRRDFLKLPGVFVASAALSNLVGCGDDDTPPGSPDGGGIPDGGGDGGFRFPQGVASGDPRQTSVVLWTRVEAGDGATAPIPVTVEVSVSSDFATTLVSQVVTATADADHTLRVIVTDLTPATRYYYRFTAGNDTISGRTLTAPAADDSADVRFAWVSCQDYVAGSYGAYRELIKDDDARPEAERIQFVVHLGDFIYETRGAGFSDALNDDFEPIGITNLDGSQRVVAAFPSGGGEVGESTFARTVADYRHLYRTVLGDPELREARARWPFIQTWDDHEFSNDCWQTQANYTNADSADEPSQQRKVASNQAWFE